ncbi:hypothetical protein IWX90DRAFT_145103 [Phyllosticta citrichinensis]|uniref:Uncharacterized protein n=1 Tax=Phyllosticta citrichinensis TaxID=1130410 RepID=A0ABR1XZ06_9PEZI
MPVGINVDDAPWVWNGNGLSKTAKSPVFCFLLLLALSLPWFHPCTRPPSFLPPIEHVHQSAVLLGGFSLAPLYKVDVDKDLPFVGLHIRRRCWELISGLAFFYPPCCLSPFPCYYTAPLSFYLSPESLFYLVFFFAIRSLLSLFFLFTNPPLFFSFSFPSSSSS